MSASLPPAAASPAATTPSATDQLQVMLRRHIQRAGQLLKIQDMATYVFGWTGAIVSTWMLACLVEHWFMPLPMVARWLIWIVTAVLSARLFLQYMVPLLVRRINPDYVAQRIEKAEPELKTGLVSWLQLESLPDNGVPRGIMAGLARHAARHIHADDPSSSLDTRVLIKTVGLTMLLMACLAVYGMLSPKSVFDTGKRILMPWSKISAPARVQLVELTPGSGEVTQGKSLQIDVKLRGLRSGEPVTVRYSTLDGQLRDQTKPLDANIDGYQFSTSLATAQASGSSGRGMQHEIDYWIEAGDLTSGPYRITLGKTPVVTLDSLVIQFPPYTKLPQRTLTMGELEAVEGSRVLVTASSNQPLTKGLIEINPELDGSGNLLRTEETVKLEVADRKLSGNWLLELNRTRDNPTVARYRLRGYNSRNDANDDPTEYRARILADVGPEVTVPGPEDRILRMLPSSQVNIEVRAIDPDFGLSNITLSIKRNNMPLKDVTLLQSDGEIGRQVKKWRFKAADYQAKVGDRFSFVATAKDNHHDMAGEPAPNQAQSLPLSIEIVAPEELAKTDAAHQPPADLEPADKEIQPGKQDSSQTTDNEPSDPNQSEKGSAKESSQQNATSNGSDSNNRKSNRSNSEDPARDPSEDAQDKPNEGNQSKDPSSSKGSSNQDSSQGDETKNQRDGGQTGSDENQGNKGSGQQRGQQSKSSQQKGGQDQNNSASASSKDDANSSGQSGESSSGQSSSGQSSSGGSSSSSSKQGKSGGQSGNSSSSQSKGNAGSAKGSSNGNSQNSSRSNGSAGAGGSAKSQGDAGNSGNNNASQNSGKSNSSNAASQKADGQSSNGQSSNSQSSNSQSNLPTEKPTHDGEVIERVREFVNDKRESSNSDTTQQPGQPKPKPEPNQNSDKQTQKAGQGAEKQAGQQGAGQQGAGQQGAGQQGAGQQGAGQQGAGQQGAGQQGAGQQGAGQQGAGQQGAGQQGAGQQGAGQQGAGQQGAGQQGAGQQGAGQQGAGQQGAGQQGAGQQGAGQQGAGQQGAGQQGAGQQGAGQQGAGQQGAGQQGAGQQGAGQQGAGQQGAGQQGAGQQGAGQQGAGQQGAGQQGAGQQGAGQQGAGQQGAGQQGAGQQGAGQQGAGQQGAGQQGAGQQGAGQQGAGQQGAGQQGAGQQGAGQQGAGQQGAGQQGAGQQGAGQQGAGQQGAGQQGAGQQGAGQQGAGQQGAGQQGAGQQGAGQQGGAGGQQGGGKPGGGQPGGQAGQGGGTGSGGTVGPQSGSAAGPKSPTEINPDAVPNGTAEANEQYANEVTNMVLDYLKDQRDQPDPELMRRLNWTKEDLDSFLKRWEAARNLAQSPNPAEQRKWTDELRALGLVPPMVKGQKAAGRDEKMNGLRDSGSRMRAPESLRRQFDAFRKAVQETEK